MTKTALKCSHCPRLIEGDDDYHDDHLETCAGTGPGCSCDLPACPSCCTWCARDRAAKVLDELVLVLAVVIVLTWWAALAVIYGAGR